MMVSRQRILEDLLDSATQQRPASVLDASHDAVGVARLTALGIPCCRAPRSGELYGLLICESSTLNRLQPFVEPGGTALVHVPPGRHHEMIAADGEMEAVGHRRCPTGTWVWLRRVCSPYTVPARVSVVVVAQDEAASLGQVLCALADEPTDPAWELVVVDRSSFDSTPDILDQVGGDLQRIRLARSTPVGDAWIAGLMAARGELIVPLPLTLTPWCGFVCSLTSFLDSGERTFPNLLRGVVYEHDSRALARQAPPLIALHRTHVPSNGADLSAMLRSPTAETRTGFRALLQRPVASAQARVAPQKLDQAA